MVMRRKFLGELTQAKILSLALKGLIIEYLHRMITPEMFYIRIDQLREKLGIELGEKKGASK